MNIVRLIMNEMRLRIINIKSTYWRLIMLSEQILERHSMSELKEAVRELLQCIIMGLSYKNVYYQ